MVHFSEFLCRLHTSETLDWVVIALNCLHILFSGKLRRKFQENAKRSQERYGRERLEMGKPNSSYSEKVLPQA